MGDLNIYLEKSYNQTLVVQQLLNTTWKKGFSIQHKKVNVNNFFSSSFVRSDKHSLFHDSQLFRLTIKGSLQTKRTTLDKLEPVTIVLTSPTTLKTKEGGESKLKVL